MPVLFYVDPAIADDVDARDITQNHPVLHLLPDGRG